MKKIIALLLALTCALALFAALLTGCAARLPENETAQPPQNAGRAAAELGLCALAGRRLAGGPLILPGPVLSLVLGPVLPLGAGAAGAIAPGLGGALLPLVGGGLRLTQLLGRTAWEGVLQGHGEGVGFPLGLVLLGGTAELGQLL